MTLPSHVTMLTGLLPPEHGARGNAGYTFDGRAHAHLPGLLKARGYATGAAISTYVLRGDTGLARLFDDYEDSIDAQHGTEFAEQQRAGAITTALAEAWIDAHRREPFFFFLHIYEPHVPYDPPEPFRSRYAHPYDGEVAYCDTLIGEFLERLRASGVYDRALIILTSDHGEGLGDHGEEQHSILLYNEALQVPLIVKLPRARLAGQTIAAPAELGDIAPTIATALGIDVPRNMRGVSLLRLLEQDAPQRVLYGETLYPRIHLGWSDLKSAIDGRFHYIHGPRPELYDLRQDPRETRDLAASEAAQVERLKRALLSFPQGDDTPSGVDPAVAERLAALGYVGTARARLNSADLPNPRDSLPALERLRAGFHLASTRRWDEAATALAAVVKEQPAMVEAWIRLGEVLLEAGRAAEAVRAFDQALARAPVPMGDVIVSQGYAQLREGDAQGARASARRAALSVPAKAIELLARIALTSGDLRTAEREAQALCALPQAPPSSRLITAEILVRRGDYVGALRALDQLERNAKERNIASVPRLDFLRADALARLARFDAAEAAYRREIVSYPNNTLAYLNLAALLVAKRKNAEVEPLLEEMARMNPSTTTYRAAAAALTAFGRHAEAARWRTRMRQAFRLAPTG
jgi:tetratricopeptide (TPR) repeat protein